MQKRTKILYDVIYSPNDLPKEFPVIPIGSPKYSPSDRPVTHLNFHNELELGYCYEGSGIFIVDDKILPFSKGDVSIIFKNQLHIAQSEKGNLSCWRFLSLDPEKLLADILFKETYSIIASTKYMPDLPNILSPSVYPKISQIIYYIICELEERNKDYQTSVKAFVLSLLVELSRFEKIIPDTPVELRRDSLLRIAPALEFISNNYMQEIKIDELAKLCSTSVRNLRRLFDKCFHLSPLEYITKLRIKMASIMLVNSDYSILDISCKVGYLSLSSFNRHFKELMKMTPREWRTSERA